eukprot:1984625-Rhodomonas_salina.1
MRSSATSVAGSVRKPTRVELTPVPCSVLPASRCRRRAELPSDSSSATSAKKKSFCDTEKRGVPPVCVGVHSYPGLIQNARLYRSLRLHLPPPRASVSVTPQPAKGTEPSVLVGLERCCWHGLRGQACCAAAHAVLCP